MTDDNSPSILDKVISSKKTLEIEQFHPADAVSVLLKNLLNREEDVLRRRFGLNGGNSETLEQIGFAYKVTRERIRQIESTAIKKIKNLKNFGALIKPVEDTITSVLEQYGGVMSEQSLLGHILQTAGETVQNRRAVVFILQELLDPKFKRIRESAVYRPSWQLRSFTLYLLDTVVLELLDIITKNGKPMSFHELLSQTRSRTLFQQHESQLNDDAIRSYIEVSKKIGKNPYNEYGLVDWGSITPKRMNDKISLVLKKRGKPMHFSEITELINQMGFDDRKAYPPTVHNELILNKQYVLIGRGIYALREWGYRPGVVADVIVDVLQKEQRPLSRHEIVELVLKQRVVKKNTVYLALTDKSRFHKQQDGTYILAQPH